MKKTLLLCCTFYIFNFTFLIFDCNAQTEIQVDVPQVDTLVNYSTQADSDSDILLVGKTKKHAPVDSVQMKRHSPKTASWLAIMPGAGQIYNKKYWKLPIVYAGLGTTGFLIYYYADKTSMYRKEYVARENKQDEKKNPKLAEIADANILELRNYYRRNMEICIGACTIVYLLSILDACVDAHLYYYDVSDNLSLGVKPKIDYNPMSGATTPCMGLVVKF